MAIIILKECKAGKADIIASAIPAHKDTEISLFLEKILNFSSFS